MFWETPRRRRSPIELTLGMLYTCLDSLPVRSVVTSPGLPLFDTHGTMPAARACAARQMAASAGIGFVAAYNLRHWPGVVPLLPMLKIPPPPCWLAVHQQRAGAPRV